jgi:hypothetical protein
MPNVNFKRERPFDGLSANGGLVPNLAVPMQRVEVRLRHTG